MKNTHSDEQVKNKITPMAQSNLHNYPRYEDNLVQI